MGADRLIVCSLAGAVAAAAIDVVGEGAEGLLGGIAAPSLRHGLARLASQVTLARSGASIDVAREAIGESFDVALEVSRAADGRIRVLRVVELGGGDAKGVAVRDVFVMSTEGTGESGYVATGMVPRVANDFVARGVKLDGAVFKRR